MEDAVYRDVRMPAGASTLHMAGAGLLGMQATAGNTSTTPYDVQLRPGKQAVSGGRATLEKRSTGRLAGSSDIPMAGPAPLLGVSSLLPSDTLRARGESLDLPSAISARATSWEQPAAPCLLTLRSVPLRPLLLATSPSVVTVRGSLEEACIAMESALAQAGVQALNVLEGNMSFYGGVQGNAHCFTLEAYEDLVYIDDAGKAWTQHIFVFEALEEAHQPHVQQLAQHVQQALRV